MVLVLGKENCQHCDIAKQALKEQSIEFQYYMLDELSPEDKKKYLLMARKAGRLAAPIIIKDDKVVDLQYVIENKDNNINVVKRDGRIVGFDKNRIINAIEKAGDETEDGIDIELANNIASDIEDDIKELSIVPDVETISNMVEEYLMDSNRKDIARKYILYREERSKLRKNKSNIKGQLLTDDFVSQYKHKKPPFTDLGHFVYLRTYSRWLSEEKRREYWWETVRRAVEYNCSLVPGTNKEEAEKLYDNVFNLRQFLSGRTLFTGGTEVSKKYIMSNYNCAFSVVDEFETFKDLFYLLLIGAGVGLRVKQDDIKNLPPVRGDIKVIHKAYTPVKKRDRKEYTSIDFEDDMVEIFIGDSKEAWTQGLDYFLKFFYLSEFNKIKTIIVNYDNIRSAGERLKTFGGYASGHQPFMQMIDKIYKLLVKDNPSKKYLKPIDCLDIANIIGVSVVSGGVRRTSEVILFDYEDEEIYKSKSNLYKQVNGEWTIDEEISHRRMSNNSIQYNKKPSREQWHKHINEMRYSGEPAFQNMVAARQRRIDAEGGNPCFTADMRLLTKDGYRTFGELDGQMVEVVNINGEVTNGKVWYTGEKETIKLILSNKKEITCTPNHKFMTIDGEECEAKNLKGKTIMPYTSYNKIFNDEYIKYGFIQGDGDLGRLKSDTHQGLEVNIGDKDQDLFFLFRNDKYTHKQGDRKIYLQGYNSTLSQLGFNSNQLPERVFPSTYESWNKLDKASFLQGCYSANGSVITNHRVSYKTTSFVFAQELMKTLKEDFGISPYMTTNKSKEVEFSNGTYTCKESYDVNIGRYEDLQKFHLEIGFYQLYKKIKLRDLLQTKAPYILNIKKNGMQKVYDFSEPKTHWGVVEGYIAHNCMEIILRRRGMCNLTETNAMGFVKDGKLDHEGLFEAQKYSARAGYRMACVDFELYKWDRVNKEDMLIGVSLTGWQDMINATNMSIEDEEILLEHLKQVAHNSANELADKLGRNRPKLYTTVKPSGTLSQMPTVSSGVHFSHSPYYVRRVRINANDPLVQVVKELGYPMFPEVGQTWENCDTVVIEFPVKAPEGKTKYDVTAIEQLEIYKRFMTHYVDHNVSITVHVRSHEWDEVEQWIWDNWNDVVAVSFLSLDDSFYQLMPYEEITKEDYERRKANMKPFNPSLLSKYEKEEVEIDLGDSECSNGVCPIR